MEDSLRVISKKQFLEGYEDVVTDLLGELMEEPKKIVFAETTATRVGDVKKWKGVNSVAQAIKKFTSKGESCKLLIRKPSEGLWCDHGELQDVLATRSSSKEDKVITFCPNFFSKKTKVKVKKKADHSVIRMVFFPL